MSLSTEKELLDLTFPAKERMNAQTAKERAVRPPEKKSPVAGALALGASAVIVALIVVFFVGKAAAHRENMPILQEALDTAAYATDTAEKAQDNADYWMAVSEEQSATIEALASEVESVTAAAGSLSIQLIDAQSLNSALRREIEKLTPKVTPQSRTVTPTAPIKTSSTAWSRDQVASTLTAAAKGYGLTAEQTAWIVETGCRVAYRESTYRPSARNGQYLGLFQFGDSWGSEAQRLDPVWSCYRFVRVYRDGGEAKINQHWKATV